jgi:hypothetical protein
MTIARRFQRREQFDVAKIPPGRLADGDVYPALKRHAIVELSLCDRFIDLLLGDDSFGVKISPHHFLTGWARRSIVTKNKIANFAHNALMFVHESRKHWRLFELLNSCFFSVQNQQTQPAT